MAVRRSERFRRRRDVFFLQFREEHLRECGGFWSGPVARAAGESWQNR